MARLPLLVVGASARSSTTTVVRMSLDLYLTSCREAEGMVAIPRLPFFLVESPQPASLP